MINEKEIINLKEHDTTIDSNITSILLANPHFSINVIIWSKVELN